MSTGWSLWVRFLIVFNLGITLFLFLWGPRAKIPTQADGTSGHVWAHGVLREGVRRLPRWWLLLSASMFAACFAYLVLYPGFGNSRGLFDWTSRGELAREVAANGRKLQAVFKDFDRLPVEALADRPEAIQVGRTLFEDNCAACHGRAGTGNQRLGAPDLTDNDWLYGGDGKSITASIRDGRHGVMPSWSSLGDDKVKDLAQYVRALAGLAHRDWMAEAAAPIFKTTCAACHGPDGKGNQAIGAPNLTDHVWLHGGTLEDIETTIRDGRRGHMPVWSRRLNADQIHVLAAYVYHLSHGSQTGH